MQLPLSMMLFFLKLDFAKAFDKVNHDYLWATLAAMHLDPLVIILLQGLITRAEVKVHVNGLYTRSFPLERGVREGDPMSPLHLRSPPNL